MGNEIPVQLAQFFHAVLLGSMLALLYDLTRALQVVGGRIRETALDVLLSISATLSVFLFVMSEEGELRLFYLLGILCGATLFFAFLSQLFRPIWSFWTHVFLLPVEIMKTFSRKSISFIKKLFPFFKKWFTIMGTLGRVHLRKGREHGAEAFQTENRTQR